jgi:hypothetical protein
MVSKMLINKSQPQPATKKAPAGGKTIVTRMRITSEALTDMSLVYEIYGRCCGVDLGRIERVPDRGRDHVAKRSILNSIEKPLASPFHPFQIHIPPVFPSPRPSVFLPSSSPGREVIERS